jgi:serine/threonine protein kinase
LIFLKREELQLGPILGEGGFAQVYGLFQCPTALLHVGDDGDHHQQKKGHPGKENNTNNYKQYCVKVLHQKLLDRNTTKEVLFQKAADDLVNEAELLAQLHHHPNIVTLRALSYDADQPVFHPTRYMNFFLVLDRLTETLNDRIELWKHLDLMGRADKKDGTGEDDHESQEVVSSTLSDGILLPQQQAPPLKLLSSKELMNVKLYYATQLAQALAFLHERRILFRDLKPENIGFRQSWNDGDHTLQLFDFGMARELPTTSSTTTPTGSSTTPPPLPPSARSTSPPGTTTSTAASGSTSGSEPPKPKQEEEEFFQMTICGTQRYMPGEVLLEGKYSLKSDCYAWAMVVWEMMAQVRPFHYMSPAVHKILVCRKGDRPPLMSCHRMPQAVKELLAISWAPNVADRIPMAAVCERMQLYCSATSLLEQTKQEPTTQQQGQGLARDSALIHKSEKLQESKTPRTTSSMPLVPRRERRPARPGIQRQFETRDFSEARYISDEWEQQEEQQQPEQEQPFQQQTPPPKQLLQRRREQPLSSSSSSQHKEENKPAHHEQRLQKQEQLPPPHHYLPSPKQQQAHQNPPSPKQQQAHQNPPSPKQQQARRPPSPVQQQARRPPSPVQQQARRPPSPVQQKNTNINKASYILPPKSPVRPVADSQSTTSNSSSNNNVRGAPPIPIVHLKMKPRRVIRPLRGVLGNSNHGNTTTTSTRTTSSKDKTPKLSSAANETTPPQLATHHSRSASWDSSMLIPRGALGNISKESSNKKKTNPQRSQVNNMSPQQSLERVTPLRSQLSMAPHLPELSFSDVSDVASSTASSRHHSRSSSWDFSSLVMGGILLGKSTPRNSSKKDTTKPPQGSHVSIRNPQKPLLFANASDATSSTGMQNRSASWDQPALTMRGALGNKTDSSSRTKKEAGTPQSSAAVGARGRQQNPPHQHSPFVSDVMTDVGVTATANNALSHSNRRSASWDFTRKCPYLSDPNDRKRGQESHHRQQPFLSDGSVDGGGGTANASINMHINTGSVSWDFTSKGPSLAELKHRKGELKEQLKRYDIRFAEKHGRMPTKAEKEPVRPLYDHYNLLKEYIAELEGLKKELKQYDIKFAVQHGRMPKKTEKEVVRHLYQEYKALKSEITAWLLNYETKNGAGGGTIIGGNRVQELHSADQIVFIAGDITYGSFESELTPEEVEVEVAEV